MPFTTRRNIIEKLKETSIRDLTADLQKGSESAFEKIYFLYKDKLYGFCHKLLASEELSEDIVQETFIRLWEKRKSLNPEKSVSSYLFTISKNLIIDHQMHYARQYELSRAIKKEEYAENNILSKIGLEEIKSMEDKVVQQLPPQQKKVYILSRHEDFSHQEIAEHLGISINSVKTNLRIALKALRNKISPASIITAIVTLMLNEY